MDEITLPFSISKKLMERKLKNLKEGVNTDFKFMVGPENAQQTVVHAHKADLLVAGNQLLVKLTKNGRFCRLEDFPPMTVQLFVEFLHICTIISKPLNTFEEVEPLMRMALTYGVSELEFLLDPLLRKTISVENIWALGKQVDKNSKIAKMCIDFLSKETSKCLEHPSFLTATPEMFKMLLSTDNLNIKSETELVDACFKLTESWSEEKRKALILDSIPQFRFLDLPVEKLSVFSKYLNNSQKLFIANNTIFKDGTQQVSASGMNVKPRTSKQKTFLQNIILNNQIVNLKTFEFNKAICSITFEVGTKDFILTGFQLLSGQTLSAVDNKSKGLMHNDRPGLVKSVNFIVEIECSSCSTFHTKGPVMKFTPEKKLSLHHTFVLREEVVLPKGSKCRLNFGKKGKSMYPRLSFPLIEKSFTSPFLKNLKIFCGLPTEPSRKVEPLTTNAFFVKSLLFRF